MSFDSSYTTVMIDATKYGFIVYGLLLSIYGILGILIQKLNESSRFKSRKIQQRECPRHLVKRDIWTSIRSLATISLFVALGYLFVGWGLGFKAPESTAGQLLSLVASLLLYDSWFYWGHRLIHTRLLFKRVHAWHHQTTTPTAWSNNSDTFLDNLFLQSYCIVVYFLLPIAPEVLLLHKVYDQITGMFGHSGFEYMASRMARFPSMLLGTTFHDQHHSHVRYNYANHFSHWDRLMGTIKEDYDQRITDFLQTKRGRKEGKEPYALFPKGR
jgi:sterol desaturase/sphingolipid hydroxylase (fatty acid hydroxylase superfamily)